MPTTLAKYFTDELTDWERTIAFYSDEMDALTSKLQEVIRRNSIPHIAEKVEIQQAGLDRVVEKFSHLQEQFMKQKALLKTDHSFIDDSLINDKTETEQSGLRQRMMQAEKECIDAKNACQLFLSGIFKNKNN